MNSEWQTNKAFLDRFWSHIKKDRRSGCWNWTGTINWRGYGRISWKHKMLATHRVSYTIAGGKIPLGYEIDHLCKNTRCLNPKHLEAVTHHTNWKRSATESAQNARKTHCKRGHAFAGKNLALYVRYSSGKRKISRECRICDRERGLRNYYARKATLDALKRL